VPNRPSPIAAQAQTFIPVNGSVPPWALADAPLPLEAEVPLESDEDDCVRVELLVDGEELPEPLLEPDDEPLGCELVVVLVSGSTY
jgi:hypothetical protein